MTDRVYGWRRASQPLRPEYWPGLEVDPGDLLYPDTVEAHFAYSGVAHDYPKAISLTNRIWIVNQLQTTATILSLHMARKFGADDARDVVRLAMESATKWGPLPISVVTPATVCVVDYALDTVLPEEVIALILIDLLRIIEGVRP